MSPIGTQSARRMGIVVWTAVGLVILGWVVLEVAGAVRIIWLPLAFAGGIVLLLNPMVHWFSSKRMPRPLGATLAFLIVAVVLFLVGLVTVPIMQDQIAEFAESLPDLYTQLNEGLVNLGERFGIETGRVFDTEAISVWLQENSEALSSYLGSVGEGAGAVIRGFAEAVTMLALAPILAFYMLLDSERWKSKATAMIPESIRSEVVFVSTRVTMALSLFVRGQLLVAIIVGIASSIGLRILDVPFWLIIGMIAGFLNLIPFVGPVVGGALAAGVALLDGHLITAVWAVLIFVAIQQVDNHVITPIVQRSRVDLSPLVIVLALIVGGSLAGLLGVLIAVPAAAAIRIVVGHLWRTRVLGESWEEASDAMFEPTEVPERIQRLRRRLDDGQQRLFDTGEHRTIAIDDQSETESGG
ncbi:MAG: AI-2E family transporter [Acidimicrobiia bacterium]|nr:AI-2E family transporter [Acidimicrobiia bacterium]